jgi:hypothetical protein
MLTPPFLFIRNCPLFSQLREAFQCTVPFKDYSTILKIAQPVKTSGNAKRTIFRLTRPKLCRWKLSSSIVVLIFNLKRNIVHGKPRIISLQ